MEFHSTGGVHVNIGKQCLFSTVARLIESHYSVEPCIPRTIKSNDFINFFKVKIILIREYILNFTDFSSATVNVKVVISSD